MLKLLLIPAAIKIVQWLSENPETNTITLEKISDEYLINYYKKNKESAIKQQITKAIEKIIKDYRYFKIGKTGVPEGRSAQHKDYDRMFVLCQTKYPEFIDNLESYYNSKYINHPKNENINEGTANRMSDTSGYYYLYVVVAG